MNSMDLFKAFGDIDESLMFDAINGGAQPQNSPGAVPVKQPKHNGPRRGGAKTKAIVIGAVAIVLAAAITCLVLYLTGVFGGKQVPIYTGMEISATNTSADDGSTKTISRRYSGDYTGRNDDLDKNNPYGGGTTIEQQAASSLDVVSAGEDIYYAYAGDDIYVKINFDNPDKYDIVSFSLSDGTNTYDFSGLLGDFESGSTYTQIIIKLNVGTTGGIIEYSISKIKYLDDNSVNSDVIIGGETVVRCGVRTYDITYASISDEAVDLTSISFTAEIVDKYSLIEYSNGYLMAILFDGESLVQTVDLQVGKNSVTFSGLSPDTIYQYAVVGYYDNLSGSGVALNYLYKNAVYTPAIVLFDEDSIEIGQGSISFGYSWYAGYSGSITSLTLTGGGETKTLDASATSISGLLSNNDYTLTATYNGTSGESSITLEFTTEAKTAPSVEITVTDATVSTLTYSVNYIDTDGVGKITAIGLYNGTTLVQSAGSLNQVEYIFSGLDAYTDYALKVSYSYNLNDGVGTQTAEQTLTENTYPSLTINSISLVNTSAVVEGGTINIKAEITNPENVQFNSVEINGETYSVLSISTETELYVNITNNGQFAGGDTTLAITSINCTVDNKTYSVTVNENNEISVFINGELTVEDFYIARYNSTSGAYEETNYGLAGEQLYYVISLGNATEYDIDSITIGGTVYSSDSIDSTLSDYNTVYIPITVTKNGVYGIANSLSSISYSKGESINKTKSFAVISGYFYTLEESDIVEIYTADDLLDVDDYAYYKLMNDIDLSGVEWKNKNNVLRGVFDGNGHTISGMGAVTEVYDTSLYIGLFSEADGIIMDLTVSAYYNMTLYNTTSGNYSIYAGGLASTSGELMVDNVNVTFTAAITLDGYVGSNVYVGGIYAGGICGNYGGTYNIVTNSTVKTNISITNKNGDGSEWVEVGGLFGRVGDQTNNILEITDTNVTFTASFTLESKAYELHIGGLVGFANLYDDYIISDVTVNSNVTVVGDSTYSSIYGVAGGGEKIYLYNVTSGMTANLSSALANKFLNEQWGYGYGEYGSDGITTDEYCNGTITINKLS